MILAPTNRRIIRPHDQPSFGHTQRYGLVKGHPLGSVGGLNSYWPFNEGSGLQALDLNGWEHTGQLYGDISWGSGMFRNVLVGGGVSCYMEIPSCFAVNPTEISFSVWTKMADTAAEYRIISYNDEGFYCTLRLNQGGTPNKIFAAVTDGIVETVAYDVTKPLHIVITAKENELVKLYVNSHLADSDAVTDFEVSGGLGRIIGASRDAAHSYFKGELGVLAIYDCVLVNAEVAQLTAEPFDVIQKSVAPIFAIVPVRYTEIPPWMEKDLINPFASGAWLWLVQIAVPGQDTVCIARNTADVKYGLSHFDKSNVQIGAQVFSGDGSIPRVTLRVFQDINREVENIVNETEGALGAQVQLIRVNEKFLNTPVNALEFDYDNLASESDTEWVTFTLGIPNPLTQRFPLRTFSSSMCPWTPPELFKGPRCQLPIGHADTSCTGTYDDCYTKGNAEHWGGELGLDPAVTKRRER